MTLKRALLHSFESYCIVLDTKASFLCMGNSTADTTTTSTIDTIAAAATNAPTNNTLLNVTKDITTSVVETLTHAARTLTTRLDATTTTTTPHPTTTVGPSPTNVTEAPSSFARALINTTKTLFDEPTKMVTPVEPVGVSHWTLILGFGFLFAVSVGCVYLVIRCLRGDGKAPEEAHGAPTTTAAASEASRLINVTTSSGAADSEVSASVPATSASRQRFLDARRQFQQQSYGATSSS